MPRHAAGRPAPDLKRRLKLMTLTGGVILLLDQLTKAWVQASIPVWQIGRSVIPGCFDIVHFLNKGAAFGFLNDSSINWQRPFFIVISLLAMGLIFILARSEDDGGPFYVTGLGLILGGAIGNLIDRIRTGLVVDFLDFYIGQWHWPAFNVADIALCAGAGALLVSFYQHRGRRVSDNL